MSTSAPTPFSTVPDIDPDQAWPTIPIEDDPTPPDTAGLSLISDIADFARPLPGLESVSDDPAAIAQEYGQDMDFDFDTGEPAGVQYGSSSYVSDEEQVEQWVAKALETPQGEYLIYPEDYGSILHQMIGTAGPDQTVFSEVARTTQDCMEAHPRVREAVVDAVFREPLIETDTIFIAARMWFDSSDDPVQLSLSGSV